MSHAAIRALTATLALAALLPATAPAQSTPRPDLSAARLQGTFAMSGRVTVARGIRGEHRGQRVLRTWTFTPLCPEGACPSVALARQRAGGVDTLVLALRRPGLYVGRGQFYVPLRCDGVVIAQGELVPFKVSVTITATGAASGATVATAIRATYANRHRTNLTPCVAVPSRDAARYTGLPAPAPT